VIITFSLGASEVFDTLPVKVKEKAGRVIQLAAIFPEMFPFRKRGVMTGYRLLHGCQVPILLPREQQ